MIANNHPKVETEGKFQRGGPKDSWRAMLEIERAEYGLKADVIHVGFFF